MNRSQKRRMWVVLLSLTLVFGVAGIWIWPLYIVFGVGVGFVFGVIYLGSTLPHWIRTGRWPTWKQFARDF